MNQATLAWAALKNMIRAAARDPLWASLALLSAPFRYGVAVFKVSIFYVLVVVFVAFMLQYGLKAIGAENIGALWMIGNLLMTAFALMFLFRLVTNPLIVHFGDMTGDTHTDRRGLRRPGKSLP